MTMTPDDLRALADAIVYRDSLAIARAADYLRAQADAQPVAWMHIDGRVISAATMDQAYRDGGAMQSSLREYTIPLYTHPAPAVPQAEPKREPLPGLAPTHRCPACGALWRQCDDASWNLRSALCCGLCDAGRVELVRLLDEPKREPLSDEQIDAALQTDPAATVLELMGGEMTVGEFKLALRRLARTVEHAHGISGGGHD